MKNSDEHFEFTIKNFSHSLCSDSHETANGYGTSTQIIVVD